MTNLTFAQLVDIDQIQRMLEAQYKITGVPSAILDADEKNLVAVGWQDICTRFHHVHPDTCERCRERDAYIKKHLPDFTGEYLDYKCRNGLRDAALPIIIAGEHLATFFTGQFFYDFDKPDVEYFRAQAREFEFDEESYLQALSRVPVFTREQINDIMDYYRNLVQVLVEMGLKNLELAREVKERKQAEKALSQSETVLRRIFETLPDQLHIIDKDFRILHSNWQHFPKEKHNQNPFCYKIFYGLERPCKNCQVFEVFRTGKPVIKEKFNPRIGYMEIRAYPVFDASGNVVTVLEHIRDISERKRADDALRESEQRLYATIQGSSLPMFVIGKDQKIIYWNKALEQLSGTKAADVIGTDRAWTAFYDEERPLLANLLLRGDSSLIPIWYAGKYSKSRLVDEAYECTDFSPKWVEGGKWLHFTAAALRDTKGNLIGAMETIEDVTERKVAEEKWHSLYNNLPGGSYTVNDEYIIEDVNDVLCAVTGFTREELIGRPCGTICPKGPHECPFFGLGKERKDNDETAVKGKDGRLVPIIKSARRIPAGNRDIILENFQDITDRKHLEEQLRHSQKMEAIGQLAGGVAHDFNNILTAIIGYGSLLQMKIGKDESLGKYVNQIIYSAERASNLTHSLLAFSRKHVIDLKAVKVNEIIEKAGKLLSRLVPEDIELRIVTCGDCVVHADSMQIEQVMMNLVTNARDAMPDGGLLTISTEMIDLDEEFIRTNGYGEPGTYVLISVSDTGVGINEQTRGRVFEPFYTTKEVGKGTGLGLSIVYGIIKQHDGYVDVRSESGKGTTFRVYLPVIEGDDDKLEIFETAASPRGSETLLLAEDEPVVRELTKSVLEEFGYTVMEAKDGVDAIEKFEANRDGIQLLILDVIMPRKDGKQVYNQIKKMRPDMKALFISGYTGDFLSRRGMLEENLNFISKPLTQNMLLRKVREVLDKRIGYGVRGAA
jgi:two-component system cell cycle sensor histidine kinase/response regulator CckA